MKFRIVAIAGFGAAALSGCNHAGDLVVGEGVGITALRTVCPAVGIPDFTGDVTLFNPPEARTADAIDVTATMTDVRMTCNDSGAKVYAVANFEVDGSRRDAHGARSVTLPFFTTVLRGNDTVVAKRVGAVTLNFADGQTRAQASGAGGAYIDKAAATLPERVKDEITRKRKSGEADAAVDPLAEPAVRAAVNNASFELLVGFQLTDDELKYNASR